MEATTSALRIKIGSLDETIAQLHALVTELSERNNYLAQENAELESGVREAETIRRRLHNEVQELRGNIRVFVRVRPSVANDVANGTTAMASMRFPNEREATQIELLAAGESALGTVTMKNHHFTFDRIFTPAATQSDVFEEVAHLAQSVLDGYNVSSSRMLVLLGMLKGVPWPDLHLRLWSDWLGQDVYPRRVWTREAICQCKP